MDTLNVTSDVILRKKLLSDYVKSIILAPILFSFLSTAIAAETSSPNVSSGTQDGNSARLEVIDSYAELYTGPGKGYPVFYVVEQSEWIEVLTRRPDWYEVRTEKGKTGWVKASQIARTLKPTGEPADLPTVSFGDYVKNRWRVGATVGTFLSGELQDAEVFTASLAYKPLSWLGGEIEWGRFYGLDINGSMAAFNFVYEPFSYWRLSPTLILGGGELSVGVQPKQVFDFKKETFFNYGIRLNYYLGRNFVVRGEYRGISLQSSSDQSGTSEELGTWSFGFSTFF